MKVKFINRYDDFQKIFRIISFISDGMPSRKFTIALCKLNIGYKRGIDEFEVRLLFIRFSYIVSFGGRFV